MKKCNLENVDCHATLAMTKNTQSGRSMIEMIGVLAIIGVLSVGGIAGYSKAMQKYRINKTIEQITLIATNVRSFYSTQQNYSGLDSDADDGKKIIQKAKLVPDEMLDIENGAITDIKDAFNQSLSIYSVGRFERGDNRAFVIDFGGSDLSKDACIELATHNWQTIENVITVAVGVEALPVSQYVAFEGCSGIDSTEPLLGCQNGDTISLPLPLDKVVNACSTASHITIKFR